MTYCYDPGYSGMGLAYVHCLHKVDRTWDTLTIHKAHQVILHMRYVGAVKKWVGAIHKELGDQYTVMELGLDVVIHKLDKRLGLSRTFHSAPVLDVVGERLGPGLGPRPNPTEPIVGLHQADRLLCAQSIMLLKSLISTTPPPASSVRPNLDVQSHWSKIKLGPVLTTISTPYCLPLRERLQVMLTASRIRSWGGRNQVPLIHWDELDHVLETCHEPFKVVNHDQLKKRRKHVHPG